MLALNQEKNEVIVGKEKELYHKQLYAKNVNWMVPQEPKKTIQCKAKIRYRAKEADCIVSQEADKTKVEFKEEQRAITPGQSIVFYDTDGIVLGGGKIL